MRGERRVEGTAVARPRILHRTRTSSATRVDARHPNGPRRGAPTNCRAVGGVDRPAGSGVQVASFSRICEWFGAAASSSASAEVVIPRLHASAVEMRQVLISCQCCALVDGVSGGRVRGPCGSDPSPLVKSSAAVARGAQAIVRSGPLNAARSRRTLR